MRKKGYAFQVRLSDIEKSMLENHAKKSGMTRSGYIRALIKGYVPRATPSEDLRDLMRQLRAIGNNMKQIAARANVTGYIHAEQYTENAMAIKEITASI